MEDIAGALELLSIQGEIRNSFKEDNKNIIFFGGLASESTSYVAPKYEGKSINIEVNAFMNTTKEIVSQIERAKDLIQRTGNDNTDDDRCMIAIRTGEILTAGRAEKACKMVFQHSTVSLVHFMVWGIQFDADSVPLVYLRDVSLNGMLINGQTIGRNQTALLYDGDIIEVRCVAVFRFREFECAQWLQTPKRQSRIKDWTISNRMLGSGSFGSVYVATHKDGKKNFAVKVIKGLSNSNNPSLRQERFKNEAEILLKINHPNIIKVHDTLLLDEHIYIFEDLICGGDLFSYLIKGNCLKAIPENEVILIVFQLLLALDYLHNQLQVIHRDLKLDNVLLKAPIPCTKIILCDFGIAKSLQRLNQRTKTIVGTVEYSAPEIFTLDKRVNEHNNIEAFTKKWMKGEGYDYKCDTWSLGIMIHIMLSGISPFYSDGDEVGMVKNAKLGQLNFGRHQWQNVSPAAKDFIRKLVEIDPIKRYSIDECIKHEWISKRHLQLQRIYESKILHQ